MMRKLIPDKRLIGIALTASVCMLVFLVVYNDYRDKAEDAVHNINGETDVDIVSINELTEEMTDIFRPSVYDTVPEEEEIVVPVIERVEFTVTDIEPAVTMYVNDTLNVRNGADISYDRIGRLYWASAVNVTGETDTGWYRIVYNGETAYVSGDYVQKESPVVTSAVVFVGDSRTVQMSRAVARNNYTW
ncbi:MAG: SH3 domain-containing protein, partial [Lachnospiraceae bacterium]|nr:SH3 domain-containing protein [Lachnospiraceae bacterium]